MHSSQHQGARSDDAQGRLRATLLRRPYLRWSVVAACVCLLALPQLRLAALHTAYYDLGQYVTNYALAALDGHWSIALRSHAHPIMWTVVPLFYVWPSPALLLLTQSALLIAGVATYAALWSRLEAGPRLVGAAVCLSSIALWSVALFDYHFEPFLFPLVFAFFLRLEQNGPRVRLELALLAFAVAAVKENYALTSIGLGLYLVASGRHRGLGVAIACVAALWFHVATTLVIPAFSEGRQAGDLWHDAFAYLGRSPLEILFNLLTQPRLLLEAGLLSPRKLLFLAAVVGPFLPVLRRAPLAALPALPHLCIMLLSKDPNHSYLANQYAAPIAIPLLVALAIVAGGRVDRLGVLLKPARGPAASRAVVTAIVGGLAATAMFGLAPGGRLFWTPQAWSFNAAAYNPTSRDRRIAAQIEQHVGRDRRLVVSMQNTLHGGGAAVRTHALAFPDGVFEPVAVLPAATRRTHSPDAKGVLADVVVLDHKRPRYINQHSVGPSNEAEWSALLARLPAVFSRTVEDDGFEVWRRTR